MPDLLEKKKPSSLDGVIKNAWRNLNKRTPDDIARCSLGELKNGIIEIPFLGQLYHVDMERREVRNDDGSIANRFFTTLILHYLAGADESDPTGELVSFRDFWGGDAYYGAFVSRAIQPIREAFADDSEQLGLRAEKLCARPANHGDVSYDIPVFPKITLTVIIWRGDEEIPGSANMLFDRLAGRIFHTEDLAALGELVARMLIQ